jgi:hypothetical protein
MNTSINTINKYLTSSLAISIIAVIVFVLFPINKAKAVDFNFTNPLDPFCLFSCDNKSQPTVQNIVNSNNNNNNTVNNINTNPTVSANYSNLSVSCYSIPASGGTNTSISWRASVSGGNYSYSYSWSGTDGLSGSGSSVDKIYGNSGTKSASLTVTSNGQTISRNCDNTVNIYDYQSYYDNYNYNYYNNGYNYYNSYSNLVASCRADRTVTDRGTYVTWYASASGGNGSYSYSWSGTDNMYGTQSYVNKYYDTSGQKYASVTVYSNGQQYAVQCTNSVYVQYDTNYYNNNNYYNPTVIYTSPSSNTNGINIACFADETNTTVSDPVTWTVESTGGYINSYSWKGSEGLSGNSSSVVISYLLPGTKTATVTANLTNGQTISKACSNKVVVKDVYTKNTSKPIVKSGTKSIVKNTPSDNTLMSFFSLNNVPWAWVAVLVIIVLLVMITYLVVNKSKL